MNIKAARDVLDYRGKHWTEFVEADVDVANFDPERIMRKIVETGSFDADASKMERLKINSDAENELASLFSAGRKFPWRTCNMVKMMACEFLPIGLQYVIYDRKDGCCEKWVKTDADLISGTEVK